MKQKMFQVKVICQDRMGVGTASVTYIRNVYVYIYMNIYSFMYLFI